MNKDWKKDYSKNKGLFKSLQKEAYGFVCDLAKQHKKAIHIANITQRPNDEPKKEEDIEKNLTSGRYKNFRTIFDIKDVAGIRVICHCEDDLENFSVLLEGELRQQTEYTNIERKEIGGKGSEYPYRAVHLTFAKKVKENGKSLQIYCEIQIRTVMADAWAVQNHKYLYKRHKEGETHELTTAVSEIMNGCEKLWSLVKKKSLRREKADYSEDIAEIHEKTKSILHLIRKSDEQAEKLNDWFESNREVAFGGLQKLGIKTFMEVRVNVPPLNLSISKKTLRDSARSSTIETFGWPIGVFLDREEFAPQVDLDGIHAEIAIKEHRLDGSISYDYWAIHVSGAFYLLKSLFEDGRQPDQIFFNTRIVRITEVLMYIRNLYTQLDIPSNAEIEIMIKHSGLEGRILGSSSPSRCLSRSYQTTTDEVPTTVKTSIDELNSNIVDLVEQFTKPLFEQFEFFELDRNVLEEIVINYLNGKVV